MCTLIALHRCIAGAPLVVAANRDEFFERPAEGPSVRRSPWGPIVAPRDVRAGGTWLGVNAHGVFAALTNRRCAEPDPTRRSRGLLVLEALAAPDAAEAAGALEGLPIDAYNPFNLLVADGATAHLVTYEGKAERFDLEAGAHVVGNVHPSDRSGKLERLRRDVLRASAAPSSSVLDELAGVCRSHVGDGPLDSACVHTSSYGTRSSVLLRIGGPGERELRYAEGPPCRNPYRDFTALFGALDPVGSAERATT
jgi:uncharacterized protein with NRDE domain